MTNPLAPGPGYPAEDEKTITTNKRVTCNGDELMEEVNLDKAADSTEIKQENNEEKESTALLKKKSDVEAQGNRNNEEDEDEHKNFFRRHKQILLVVALIMLLCGVVIFARFGLEHV